MPLIEMEDYFQSAHDNFLKKDIKAAAAELRKGAALSSVEATRAKGDTKTAIHVSAEELDILAEDIEKGATDSEKDFSNAMILGYHALALHHRERASESWAKKEAKKKQDRNYMMPLIMLRKQPFGLVIN